MNRLRDERGFSLTELLMAMTLMSVVLSATLTPFDSLHKTHRRNEQKNEAQDQARTAMDRMARELRNVSGESQPIEKAEPFDLVFHSVDAAGPGGQNARATQRIRYCVDASAGTVWRQRQTWTTSTAPATPSTSSCPDSAWGGQTAVAEHVVNAERPLFSYNSGSAAGTTAIRLELFVDIDAGQAPAETTLSTGVFLRNQNGPPTASFTATVTDTGHVLLNGSASQDPEGGPLTYRWCLVSGCDEASKIGSGATYDYAAPGSGSYTFYLQVTDSSGLTTESAGQTVSVS